MTETGDVLPWNDQSEWKCLWTWEVLEDIVSKTFCKHIGRYDCNVIISVESDCSRDNLVGSTIRAGNGLSVIL